VHADILTVRKANIELQVGRPNFTPAIRTAPPSSLMGDNSSIRGLVMTSEAPAARGDKLEQSGIVISGAHNTVVGNTVSGFMSAASW